MTENPQPTADRTSAIVLTVLGVVAVLFLASPLGWDYLIPQVWISFVQGLDLIGQAAAWMWHTTIEPVFGFLGSIFA